MSIPTRYLRQGLTGSLGKYQIDAESLEQLGYLKSGTMLKIKSPILAINSSANWSGRRGINSKIDFLSSVTEQESAILQLLEKHFQTYLKNLTTTLTQDQIMGLLMVSWLSGPSAITNLINSISSDSLSSQTISKTILINVIDVFEQSVSSNDTQLLTEYFLNEQLSALTAQISKITLSYPVIIPDVLKITLSDSEILAGDLEKISGLTQVPGGLDSLISAAGGLTNTLGGAAGALAKSPGGLGNVPSNLSSVANKIPQGVTSKNGGLLGSLNKVSSIAGKLPGALNNLSGTVPTSLVNIIPAITARLSLLQQYQAGVHASELGRKLSEG